jgi:hypothetical protein
MKFFKWVQDRLIPSYNFSNYVDYKELSLDEMAQIAIEGQYESRKIPYQINNADIGYLHQFPFDYYPRALGYRYNEGLKKVYDFVTKRTGMWAGTGKGSYPKDIQKLLDQGKVVFSVVGKKTIDPETKKITKYFTLKDDNGKDVMWKKDAKQQIINKIREKYPDGKIFLANTNLYLDTSEEYQNIRDELKRKSVSWEVISIGANKFLVVGTKEIGDRCLKPSVESFLRIDDSVDEDYFAKAGNSYEARQKYDGGLHGDALANFGKEKTKDGAYIGDGFKGVGRAKASHLLKGYFQNLAKGWYTNSDMQKMVDPETANKYKEYYDSLDWGNLEKRTSGIPGGTTRALILSDDPLVERAKILTNHRWSIINAALQNPLERKLLAHELGISEKDSNFDYIVKKLSQIEVVGEDQVRHYFIKNKKIQSIVSQMPFMAPQRVLLASHSRIVDTYSEIEKYVRSILDQIKKGNIPESLKAKLAQYQLSVPKNKGTAWNITFKKKNKQGNLIEYAPSSQEAIQAFNQKEPDAEVLDAEELPGDYAFYSFMKKQNIPWQGNFIDPVNWDSDDDEDEEDQISESVITEARKNKSEEEAETIVAIFLIKKLKEEGRIEDLKDDFTL